VILTAAAGQPDVPGFPSQCLAAVEQGVIDGQTLCFVQGHGVRVPQVVVGRPGGGDGDVAVVVRAQRQRVRRDVDGGDGAAGAVVQAEPVVVATDDDQVSGPHLDGVVARDEIGCVVGAQVQGC
jgi:hypothetical protein